MASAVAARVRVPNVKKTPTQCNDDDVEALKAICIVLQSVAQKYVPESAFADRHSLVQCLRLLNDLGVSVSIKADYCADFDNNPTHENTLAYRLLRSRAIAALSTIADLDKKTLDRSTTEYHNGMRAAYKKVSSIAVAFLSDIQGVSGDRYAIID